MWYHGDDREYLCVGTLGDDGQVEVEVVHGFPRKDCNVGVNILICSMGCGAKRYDV